MTISEILYNILTEADLTVPNIVSGIVPSTEEVSPLEGLLTFFPLPSPAIQFGTNKTTKQYQINIWHEDQYTAEEYMEEVINSINSTAGIQNGKALIIKMDSDLGGIYEEAGDVWHYTTIFDITYNRTVS